MWHQKQGILSIKFNICSDLKLSTLRFFQQSHGDVASSPEASYCFRCWSAQQHHTFLCSFTAFKLAVSRVGQGCHWPYVGHLYWQWDTGGHGEVPLGHCRRNRFLGPAWASPSLLLMFFGKCRWLCFFPGFPLLLVLNFTGAVPSQEIVLWE